MDFISNIIAIVKSITSIFDKKTKPWQQSEIEKLEKQEEKTNEKIDSL